MYEETKSSIDWKGIFLKVIIAFLVILIAVKGYSILKGNNNKPTTTTDAIAESKSSSTFTENIEKLRNAGEKYFNENTDKLPKEKGNTTMVTLNELINNGIITALTDENGKTCDGESSYVTATLEGTKNKLKTNLVCGSASSYSLVYMSENDSKTEEKEETNKTTSSTTNKVENNTSTSTKTETNKTTSSCGNTCANSCGNTCGTPVVSVNTNTTATQNVVVNPNKNTTTTTTTTTKKKVYTVEFDSNGGKKEYSDQKVEANEYAYDPGKTTKSGYTFKGWYLNNKKFDFDTPITKNITLKAKFTKTDYDDEDEYEENTYESYVFSMGWEKYNTDYIDITHTLKLPSKLANNDDIEEVKIASIEFYNPLTLDTQINAFYKNHKKTFIYDYSEWDTEKGDLKAANLAKITDAEFKYDKQYKDLDDAIDEGFEVRWYTNDITRQCSKTFKIDNGDEVASTLCGYGIEYKVTWKYRTK